MDDLVILVNDRDRRTFAWLRAHVGDEAIETAIQSLAGARKAYVSNLCKVLGVTAPDDLNLTPKEVAKNHLAAAFSILRDQKK